MNSPSYVIMNWPCSIVAYLVGGVILLEGYSSACHKDISMAKSVEPNIEKLFMVDN